MSVHEHVQIYHLLQTYSMDSGQYEDDEHISNFVEDYAFRAIIYGDYNENGS